MSDAYPGTLSAAFDRFGEVRGVALIETAGDLANSLYRLSAGRVAALVERPGVGLRNWKAHDRAVAAGYAATMARAPALVSTLIGRRQRPSAPTERNVDRGRKRDRPLSFGLSRWAA